ncbi:Xanthine dehydrogenase molybdenum-binding subunit [Luteitalea pratensis]|uniref:Xanthine dehydrogenase molybdenum-binding subunit n=1 Tax=Luteitalea pratensis TaxID=1855912 RepID=A0A143PXI2_LUTPR|nr:xanthine dehydrogenase family protein molybdopterin-binding subunit [Luteitalea pratensis]AMY12928.1 Xanthine dehydrogenase molybdenum-binding subunit [Luteitalea pratensis]
MADEPMVPIDSPIAGDQVAEVNLPASANPNSPYAWPKERKILSTRVNRIDGPLKVSGRAKYSYDVKRPGLLYGRILRSPHPHARITSIDLAPALAMKGVKAAVTIAKPGGKVMYVGDEVAAVAAATEDQARDAARAIKVEYEVLPFLASVEQALRPEAPPVFDGGNVKASQTEEEGNLQAGFAAAAHVVEQTYNTQVQTHVSLETHGCVCEWEGEKLTAWVSTQAVHGTREGFATSLGIPQANVRVITEHMGGGFGSKFGPDVQGIACARLAKEAKAPVQLMLDRREEHLAAGNRPSAYAKIKAGVSADGMLTAFDAETWGTGGAGASSGFPLPYIYTFPNRRRVHKDVYINAGQQRAMRAPGHPQGCFITEMLMDELADRVKMDPIEFRIRNLPPQAPNAMWREYFKVGASKFGWDKRHATGDPAPGPIKRGMGCAANRWGGGGRGTQAQCEILPDGGVVVRCGTQDLGVGTRTLIAVIAAETLGLQVKDIKVEIGDSNYPFSGGSGGSTTAPAVSPAIRVTVSKALQELATRVAPAIGVPAAQVTASNGRVHARDAPSKGLSWADACKRLQTTPVSVNAAWEAGLSASGSSGVQFAEVSVDVETGVAKVDRILCVQDCGLIVNQLTAESQCIGGMIMGVGYALYEDRILDRNTAAQVNPNMEWYMVPGMSDIPKIDIMLMNQPERGVIGIGEPPTISTAAAIANAVANAIGVRVRSIPLTPQKVITALGERAGGTL